MQAAEENRILVISKPNFLVSNSVERIFGKDPGSSFPEGETQIGYRARDDGGASSYCWFTVTVNGKDMTGSLSMSSARHDWFTANVVGKT